MASAAGPLYYCYGCEGLVRPATSGPLVCQDCDSEFLEEHIFADDDDNGMVPRPSQQEDGHDSADDEIPSPGQQARYSFGQFLDDVAEILSFVSHATGQHLLHSAAESLLFGDLWPGRAPDGLSYGPPHNNDILAGPGLEQLVQEFVENSSSGHSHALPASISVVDRLPTRIICQEHLGTDAALCAVCKDGFALYSTVKELPCKHIYHADCILPWLAEHSSCPVCRYELPIDISDYEREPFQAPRQASLFGSASNGDAPEPGRRACTNIATDRVSGSLVQQFSAGHGNAQDDGRRDCTNFATENTSESVLRQFSTRNRIAQGDARRENMPGTLLNQLSSDQRNPQNYGRSACTNFAAQSVPESAPSNHGKIQNNETGACANFATEIIGESVELQSSGDHENAEVDENKDCAYPAGSLLRQPFAESNATRRQCVHSHAGISHLLEEDNEVARGFFVTAPWFRGVTSSVQSSIHAQGENLSQRETADTHSTRSVGEGSSSCSHT